MNQTKSSGKIIKEFEKQKSRGAYLHHQFFHFLISHTNDIVCGTILMQEAENS